MAVRIRLTRVGATKQPTYRVVVADARSARESAYAAARRISFDGMQLRGDIAAGAEVEASVPSSNT